MGNSFKLKKRPIKERLKAFGFTNEDIKELVQAERQRCIEETWWSHQHPALWAMPCHAEKIRERLYQEGLKDE